MFILYMISLDGSLYEPIALCPYLKDISFIQLILKLYLSIIEFDEPEKLCWKHEMILFQWRI